MTRRDKCTACRKAKIKCDESIPQCYHCAHLGRVCTRDYNEKKVFKFVRVSGETAEPATSLHLSEQTRGSQGTLATAETRFTTIVDQRHSASVGVQRNTAGQPRPQFSQADLFWPRCEGVKLLARWTSMTTSFIEYIDSYGGWSAHVPQYLGTSEALDSAARCLLESRQAMANPMEANLRNLRVSNVHAVKSIRQALEKTRLRSCKGDILLAIQLLYACEILLMHNPFTFVIHVEGLLTLLNEHRKHLGDSDDQERLISRIIFQSTLATGLVPALLTGTNHKFDDPGWLATPLLPRNIPGITTLTAEWAWTKLAHSFILIPRLARLVRLLTASPDSIVIKQETIDLAQYLYTNTVEADFNHEAKTSGELALEPTIVPEIATAVPTSYRFGSVRLSVFLSSYWSCRLLICGLLEVLIATVPFASPLFSAQAIHDEDSRLATNAFMAVQHTLTAAASDSTLHRAHEMRLLMLMQAAFGSWYRLEKRLNESGEAMKQEELHRTKRMKQLCLHFVNRLQAVSHANPLTEFDLEALVKLYSGGPLFATF